MNPLQRCVAWIVILWSVNQARSFLIPMFLAALLCFLVSFLVDLLKQRGLSERLAVTVSSLLLFLPVFVIAILVFHEGSILVRDYPQIIASWRDSWGQFKTSPWVSRWSLAEYIDFSDLESKLGETAGKSVGILLNGMKALAEAGINVLVVLFFTVLMLMSRAQIRKSVGKLWSNSRTLDEIIHLIEKFLMARLGIALFVTVLDILILKVSGSRYSVLLGCFLGISTLIPVVGFLVAIIPPIALSLATGHSALSTFLMTFFLYLVSTVESHWITPKYLGRQLNLNLLATFVGLFAGERLWGIWGIVLSIPLLGILRIVLESSREFRPWAVLLADKDGAH